MPGIGEQVTEGVLPDTLDNALCASAVVPCSMESLVDRRQKLR